MIGGVRRSLAIMRPRTVPLSIGLLAWSAASAQEHPYLSTFTVQEGFGTVELAWTMIAGSTCEGTSILRSTDGSDFHVIGRIEGLCGAVGEPIP